MYLHIAAGGPTSPASLEMRGDRVHRDQRR